MRRDSWNWIGLCVSTALAAVIATGATAQNPPKPQRLPPGTPSTSPTPAPAPTVVPGAAPDGVSDGFVKQNIKDVIGSSKPQDLNGEPLQNFDPNEPPSIHFEPPIADMGEMIADVPKTITIKIKNVTDKPIRISKAIPGCGCTTPNWPKDPIAPGATGDCEITLRPGPKQGIKLSKKVTFQIEGHAPVVLSVEGDVVAYVTMTPDIIESPADAAAAGVKPTEIFLSRPKASPSRSPRSFRPSSRIRRWTQPPSMCSSSTGRCGKRPAASRRS